MILILNINNSDNLFIYSHFKKSFYVIDISNDKTAEHVI